MKSLYKYILETFETNISKLIAKKIFGKYNEEIQKCLDNFENAIISANGSKTYNLSNKNDKERFYKLFDSNILKKYGINNAEELAPRASDVREYLVSAFNKKGKNINIIDKIAEQLKKKERDFETKRAEAVNTIESIFDIEEGTNKVDDLKKFDKDSKDIIVCRSIIYPDIPCLFYKQKELDIEENGKVKITDYKDEIDYYYLDFLLNRYDKSELRDMFASTKYGYGYASRWYPVSCYYNHFVKNPNPTEKEFNNE